MKPKTPPSWLLALLLAGCDGDHIHDMLGPIELGAPADLTGASGDGPGGGSGDGGGSTPDLWGDGAGDNGHGPTIVITAPLAGTFVGGLTSIQATITDDTGVEDTSVVAVFGGSLATSVKLQRTGISNIFVGSYDVGQLGTTYVLPSLSVRALDIAGNSSEVAEEVLIDNTKPLLAIHPPQIYVAKLQNGLYTCSHLTDSVGSEVIKDGDKVGQVFTVRARVEDRGNWAPNLRVTRISLIKTGSVRLFVSPQANGPLAVDLKNAAPYGCNDINPSLIPSNDVSHSNEAFAIGLAPIAPAGVADFTGAIVAANVQGCATFNDGSASAPLPLCLFANTPLTVAINYAASATEPAIYTVPPINTSNSFECVGQDVDSLNHIPEGPACVAVVAEDNVGNRNVSEPLRICIDRGGGQCNGWPPNPLPTCTGRWNPTTKQIVAGTCTPDLYPASNEVRFLP